MIGDQHEVDFHKYCSKCKYFGTDESDPNGKCWDCLETPTRQDSRKPINYKEASENEKSSTAKKQSNGSKGNRRNR